MLKLAGDEHVTVFLSWLEHPVALRGCGSKYADKVCSLMYADVVTLTFKKRTQMRVKRTKKIAGTRCDLQAKSTII